MEHCSTVVKRFNIIYSGQSLYINIWLRFWNELIKLLLGNKYILKIEEDNKWSLLTSKSEERYNNLLPIFALSIYKINMPIAYA